MINRVVLVGRLTRDVEVRKTTSGLSVARFTVACDRRVSRNRDGGANQQTADFISCVAFNQPADFLGQYARKGAMIGVDGRIQTGSYERDGQRVYTTDVVAENVRLLESRSQSEQRPAMDSGYQDNYQQTYSQPSPAPSPYDNGPEAGEDFGGGLDISSDDLPF